MEMVTTAPGWWPKRSVHGGDFSFAASCVMVPPAPVRVFPTLSPLVVGFASVAGTLSLMEDSPYRVFPVSELGR
jgi:hypothetical protein